MPSTVASLFAAAGVARQGAVGWGEVIPAQATGSGTGVYVVALPPELASPGAALAAYPVSATAVQKLLDVRRELTLDGARPDARQLGVRLFGFWCPDEVVLYIGRAGPRL